MLFLACVLLLWFRRDVSADLSAPLDAAVRVQLVSEIQARRALADGELPLWDAYQFGGRPHLADPRTLILYPPHVVFRLAPIELFRPLTVLFHAWIAGIGSYLIGRYLAAALAASMAGGLATVVTVGAQAADPMAASNFYALCWVPLTIAYALRTSDERAGQWPRGRLIAVLALGMLAGSARGAWYAVGAVLATYVFATAWQSPSPGLPRRLAAQFAITLFAAAGLTAFQTVPAGLLKLSQEQSGLRDDDVRGEKPLRLSPNVLAALQPLQGHRTASTCDTLVDAGQLAAAGIPTIGGQGGLYSARYARMLNIVRGDTSDAQDVYRGMGGFGGAAVRSDLLNLLGIDFLVSCDRPDRHQWALATALDGGAVYRRVSEAGRAFWTCSPRQVNAAEVEYALRAQRGVTIHVRWTTDVDDERRRRDEEALAIRPLRFLGDRTWQYELTDPSPSRIATIVRHPDVEDTHGVDRSTYTVLAEPRPDFSGGPKTEWLLDATCEHLPVTVITLDRADGAADLEVNAPRDGVLVLSDTYDPGRGVRVDGTVVNALRVNLAFTAVPVAAGIHRVQLQYGDAGLRAGAGISALTLLLCSAAAWRMRRSPDGRSATAAARQPSTPESENARSS